MAVSGVGAGADLTPPALRPREALAPIQAVQKDNSLPPPAVSPAANDEELSFEDAMKRKAARDLEAEKLMCSLENKDACMMCSG